MIQNKKTKNETKKKMKTHEIYNTEYLGPARKDSR